MGKVKYILSRVKKMNFGSMGELAQTVSARSGKPKGLVMLDMIWCGVRYQAGYTDYELFNMERANAKQRKTYVTRGVNDRLVARFNDAAYRHIFVNKDEFNTVFSAYLGRGWMRIALPDEDGFDLNAAAEALRDFCRGKTEIVAKPRDGMCGKGVQMLHPADYDDYAKFYTYLQSIGTGVLEDVIVQHPDMAALHPDSINTLRMVTLNNGRAVTNTSASTSTTTPTKSIRSRARPSSATRFRCGRSAYRWSKRRRLRCRRSATSAGTSPSRRTVRCSSRATNSPATVCTSSRPIRRTTTVCCRCLKRRSRQKPDAIRRTCHAYARAGIR